MQFNLRSSARGQGAYREIAGKYQGEVRKIQGGGKAKRKEQEVKYSEE